MYPLLQIAPGDGAGMLTNPGAALEQFAWIVIIGAVLGTIYYLVFVMPGEVMDERDRKRKGDAEVSAHSKRLDRDRERFIRERRGS